MNGETNRLSDGQMDGWMDIAIKKKDHNPHKIIYILCIYFVAF